MKLINTAFIFILISISAFAIKVQNIPQKIAIGNFIVKENALYGNKLNIIATDDQGKLPENIEGVFQFSINGFKNELNFSKGISLFPQEIHESTFIYLRHKNESGTRGKLYYIYNRNGNLKPLEISWFVLAIIPLGLLILVFIFRKLIIIGGVLLVLLVYFNSTNGLNLSTFLETIFDGLRNLV